MPNKNLYIISILIIIIFLIYFMTYRENFADNPEALYNIYSIFNKDEAIITNINVSNSTKFPGEVYVNNLKSKDLKPLVIMKKFKGTETASFESYKDTGINATEYPVYAIASTYFTIPFNYTDTIMFKKENGTWWFRSNFTKLTNREWNIHITFFHKSIASGF